MFKRVHHVHYVVRNRDEMVAFLEKNFGMKPDDLEDHQQSNNPALEALYTIGDTQMQITQPLGTTTVLAKHLAKHGPGLFHVAWAVDDIRGLAKNLKKNGIKPRGADEDGVSPSGHGEFKYFTTNVDPADALGLWFQIAQDQKK